MCSTSLLLFYLIFFRYLRHRSMEYKINFSSFFYFLFTFLVACVSSRKEKEKHFFFNLKKNKNVWIFRRKCYRYIKWLTERQITISSRHNKNCVGFLWEQLQILRTKWSFIFSGESFFYVLLRKQLVSIFPPRKSPFSFTVFDDIYECIFYKESFARITLIRLDKRTYQLSFENENEKKRNQPKNIDKICTKL